MKNFLFATFASLLFFGGSAILTGAPVEDADDYSSDENGQFCSSEDGSFSDVIQKKKKGKGKKGKKGSKKGKGKKKKSSTDADSFDLDAVLAMDANYSDATEATFGLNSDEEDAQFTSSEDDDSFVSAQKKKGKGKKGKKGKGKGKKGKGKGKKKSSTEAEVLIEVMAETQAVVAVLPVADRAVSRVVFVRGRETIVPMV